MKTDIQNYKYLGNDKQVISAYELQFTSGRETGKNCILATNGDLQVLFNKDNALDISWLKYKGKNISFLSKNGINSNKGEFSNCFEGGFLYTCGLDNLSKCVENKPVHGSLHNIVADDIKIEIHNDEIYVKGIVCETALLGRGLSLERCFILKKDCIEFNDKIINHNFIEEEYMLLYHINFGYPFLSPDLIIKADIEKSEGLTPFAKDRIKDQKIITEPIPGSQEQVFYNYLKNGLVCLENSSINTACNIEYDNNDFPVTIEWKCMVSGNYALGIEPSTTRFDQVTKNKLFPGEEKDYKIKITFFDTSK